MHSHFKVPRTEDRPEFTISLSSIIGFRGVDYRLSPMKGWAYEVYLSSGATLVINFRSQNEAVSSYEELKKDLNIFDDPISFEELT